MIRVNDIKIPIEKDSKEELEKKIFQLYPLLKKNSYQIVKKSIDARDKNNIFYVYQVDFDVFNEDELLKKYKKLSKSNYDKFYKYLEENCSKILFTDADKLTEINKEKLTFIKSLRLINGYEDGTFRPYNKITRAEVATIISRYMDLVK